MTEHAACRHHFWRNGNIAVAGTLSPGASPGTMTVNGNVALAGNVRYERNRGRL